MLEKDNWERKLQKFEKFFRLRWMNEDVRSDEGSSEVRRGGMIVVRGGKECALR